MNTVVRGFERRCSWIPAFAGMTEEGVIPGLIGDPWTWWLPGEGRGPVGRRTWVPAFAGKLGSGGVRGPPLPDGEVTAGASCHGHPGLDDFLCFRRLLESVQS